MGVFINSGVHRFFGILKKLQVGKKQTEIKSTTHYISNQSNFNH